MADAMKLLPCPFCGEELRMRLGSNAYGHCATKGCHSHRAQIVPLDDFQQVEAWNRRASPPAREEAPAEGAGELGDAIRRLEEMADFFDGATDPVIAETVCDEHARDIRLSLRALRNRTSEPEARAVAWRWRNKPSGVWNYQEAIQRIPNVEQQALYTHPAPATADKLRVAVEALEAIRDEARSWPRNAAAKHFGKFASDTLAALNEGGE